MHPPAAAMAVGRLLQQAIMCPVMLVLAGKGSLAVATMGQAAALSGPLQRLGSQKPGHIPLSQKPSQGLKLPAATCHSPHAGSALLAPVNSMRRRRVMLLG